MKSRKTVILVLDDEPDIRREIKEYLSSPQVRVMEAATPSQAFRILSEQPIDIAVVDIRLPEMSGLDVLKEIRQKYPDTLVIIISGHGDMDSVIQALRQGAVDFFKKPFRLQEMEESIEKNRKWIFARKQLNKDHAEDSFKVAVGMDFGAHLIAVSPAMKAVVEKMERVARSKDTTVLITGESGTGKELIARGIHYLSSRREKPFHPANCSSIPDELFESEFFGHKKGAFTGAHADKDGWFEAADKGTLFLDEIGDLKPNLQSKLLRVIEDKQINRLGSTVTKQVDVRIIAATNQDLEELIRQGRFRSDLFHRLNTFVIYIPPLRERPEAIPLLINYYLEYYSKKLERKVPNVDPCVLDILAEYDFPGNVRELQHMVERALILCEGDLISMHHFDHLKIKIKPSHLTIKSDHTNLYLHHIEKQSIQSALKKTNNNKSQAARVLSISRQALDRKIQKLGIQFNR